MALNPILSTLANGTLFPAPFEGEFFVLQRTDIDLELNDVPREIEGLSTSWKGRGSLILSATRAVFIAQDQRGVLKGFDFPLAYIRKHKFNQPIFGCNNITGEVWSILDNGGPSGSLPPIRFRWAFKSGGVGTFLPLYYTFMKRSQVPFRTQEQQSSSKPMCAPSKLIATALVDPNDPTMLYLTQPMPSAPPMPPPVYAKNYGEDEMYQPM